MVPHGDRGAHGVVPVVWGVVVVVQLGHPPTAAGVGVGGGEALDPRRPAEREAVLVVGHWHLVLMRQEDASSSLPRH